MFSEKEYSKEKIRELVVWFLEDKALSGSQQSNVTYNGRPVPSMPGFLHLNSKSYEFEQEKCRFADFSVTEFMSIHSFLKGRHLSAPEILKEAQLLDQEQKSFEDIHLAFLLLDWSLRSSPYPNSLWEKKNGTFDTGLDRLDFVSSVRSLEEQLLTKAVTFYKNDTKSLLNESMVSMFEGTQYFFSPDSSLASFTLVKGNVLIFARDEAIALPKDHVTFAEKLSVLYFRETNLIDGTSPLMAFKIDDILPEQLNLHADSFHLLEDPKEQTKEFLSTVSALTISHVDHLGDRNEKWWDLEDDHRVSLNSKGLKKALESARALN